MPPSKSKRKSKDIKRLKSQDGTLISDDKTMLTRKVSLTNLGESSSKSVRDLANNFESQQKPTNETELMEEETTGESSSDEEVFSDDEEDEAESEQNEVSMKEMMRQMSGYACVCECSSHLVQLFCECLCAWPITCAHTCLIHIMMLISSVL